MELVEHGNGQARDVKDGLDLLAKDLHEKQELFHLEWFARGFDVDSGECVHIGFPPRSIQARV